MLKIIYKVLIGPATGNILEIISIIIALVGLIISIITMKYADSIKDDVKKIQSRAIDKSNFNTFRVEAVRRLERAKKGVINSGNIISGRICNDTVSIIGEMNGYETIFNENHKKMIEECYESIKKLNGVVGVDSKKKVDRNYITEYIDITTKVINILNKGEYSI